MSSTSDETIASLNAALTDRYVLERELGEGLMATVYLARDVRHGRRVAMKVLKPELTGTLAAERFLREIQVAAHLTHPHILPLLDSGQASGRLYYVMPYVEGETLRARLERVGQLSIEEALRIAEEVADGLAYAHGLGLVHRDIKPDNILLSSGHAVISDFGIARALDQAADERLTRTGFAAGTPFYMSPEQWAGVDRLDGRSDQYSLACMLYEMLVGEAPFTGPSTMVIMARHTHAPVPSVRIARPNVPSSVESAITRAMSKVAEDRFGTVEEFAQALSEPQPAAPLDGASRARRDGGPILLRDVLPGSLVARAAVGLLVIAAIGYPAMQLLGPHAAVPQTRLVVLPFANIGDPEDAHFAEGVTDAITTGLAGVGRLGVIARTSAVQYRDGSKGARQIGQELGVDYLIEGNVLWREAGSVHDSVRVSASLVSTRDGTQVWAGAYYKAVNDVFEVQSSIAKDVTVALGLLLEPSERERLDMRPTHSLEAYEHYLLGNSAYDRSWSRTDVETALAMYEKAVEIDPDFALAYARLAQTHAWIYQLRFDLSEDRVVAAKRAADRAVALDPDLPEAHIALGLYFYWGRDNYERALAEFATASRLQPSNARVFLQTGNVRRRQGRFDEAIESYRRSAELDPRSHRAWFNLGETLLLARRYEEAKPHLERVTDLAPDFLEGYVQQARLAINASGDMAVARRILRLAEERIPPTAWRAPMLDFARIVYASQLDDFLERLRPGAYGLDSATYHIMKGRLFRQMERGAQAYAQYDSARVELERMREDRPEQAWIHGLLGVAYAGVNRPHEAVRSAERAAQLLPVAKDALDGPEWLINLATVHAMLGDEARAVEYLDRALSIPSWISIHSLQLDPVLAPLRAHPRFQALVAKWSRRHAAVVDSLGSAADVAP